MKSCFKKDYESPEMEIYELTTEDVLSSSAANEDFDVTDGEW